MDRERLLSSGEFKVVAVRRGSLLGMWLSLAVDASPDVEVSLNARA